MAIRPTSKTGKRRAASRTPPPSPRRRRNAKGVVVEPQPFDNVERLRENADDAARLARKVYITFLLIGTYIAITIGSTTDLQLLKGSPVKLPVLDVGLPIVGFYALVPWLLVLLHFNLLLLLYLLSRKLHLVDGAIAALKVEDEREREEQRALLFPFPFSQMLIGRQKSWLVSLALNLVTWVTLIILPISLLIWAQVRFLPYHDISVTWSQRATVILDLALVWAFWPMIVTPSGTWSTWLKNIFVNIWRAIKTSFTSFKEELPGLLRRAKSALPGAYTKLSALPGAITKLSALPRTRRIEWRRWWKHFQTMAIGWWNLYQTVVFLPLGAIQRLQRILTLVFITAVFSCFSVFVATVPGEDIERWAAEQFSSADDGADALNLVLTTVLFHSPGAPFHRNLRLAEAVLVAGEPSAEAMQALRVEDEATREKELRKVVGLNLANRDLRFADLRNALLPKANLRGAALDGADLRGAKLFGADFRPFDLTDGGTCVQNEPPKPMNLFEQIMAGIDPPRKNGKFCLTHLKRARLRGTLLLKALLPFARLQGANLRDARLQGADLAAAQLQGANLRDARLQGANLRDARLQGANLRSARLQDANLRRARLQDADLAAAQLQGADLSYAQLQGADLSYARLQGADLRYARLQGANLRDARLQGANLRNARLQGANLRGARLEGADLDAARLQGADLLSARLQGADLYRARLQGANLRDARLEGADLRSAATGGAGFGKANLSLADLRELDRKPLTEKDYGELKKQLVAEVSDEKLRNGILVTLKEGVDRLDNLEDAKAAENVLCDAPVLLPGKPCPSKQTVAEYDKSLVDKVLGPLACDDEADPAIALSLARREISAGRVRPPSPLLASALLDPKCKGGAALPVETKAELKKIVKREEAADKR